MNLFDIYLEERLHALELRISWLKLGFSCGSDSKEFACHGEELGLIPGSGRSPREGNGMPVLLSGEFHGWRSLAVCSPWRLPRVRHDWFKLLFIIFGNLFKVSWSPLYKVGHRDNEIKFEVLSFRLKLLNFHVEVLPKRIAYKMIYNIQYSELLHLIYMSYIYIYLIYITQNLSRWQKYTSFLFLKFA